LGFSAGFGQVGAVGLRARSGAAEQCAEFVQEGEQRVGLGRLRGGVLEEFDQRLEVGFFDGAGFEAEGEGVRIGRDAHGADFEEFLFEVAAADWGACVGEVFPAQGDEADGDGAEEAAFVEAVGELGHRVFFDGELHALEEVCAPACAWLLRRGMADFCDERFADGVGEAPVAVGVLEDGVFAVVVQPPAGHGDDLVVAVERGVGTAEIEGVRRRVVGGGGSGGVRVELAVERGCGVHGEENL